MKHTKKLIPAIGMLLLSACMLVTSTFAWFSMNTTVKATGMSVSAKGDQVYLQIVNGKDKAAFKDSEAQIVANAQLFTKDLQPTNVVAALTNENTSYTPYAGGKNFQWVSASSATVDDWEVGQGGYEVVTAEKHALETNFMIRLNEQAGKTQANGTLRISDVSFATGKDYSADAFASCVSVLVVCGNQSQLYKQKFTTTTEENDEGEEVTVVTYEIGKFVPVDGSDSFLDKDAEKNVFANTQGVQVDVYVFFDGENPNCTISALNAAQSNAAGYAVDVFFTCA